MKKTIVLLATVLAVSSVLTGCGKQSQQTPAATVSSSVSTNKSDTDNKESSEMSQLLEEDHTPIYAYGKENIDGLVAKALTALGSNDDATFDRCREGDDWGESYKELREYFYKGIEKSGGDPSQKFTCKDFTVYVHQEFSFMETPWYEIYLKGYENDVVFNFISKVNDIDKQEYYICAKREEKIRWSTATYEEKPTYEVAQEMVAEGKYTLIDLSQYENKEVSGNE